MPLCHECGYDAAENSEFCPMCGFALRHVAPDEPAGAVATNEAAIADLPTEDSIHIEVASETANEDPAEELVEISATHDDVIDEPVEAASASASDPEVETEFSAPEPDIEAEAATVVADILPEPQTIAAAEKIITDDFSGQSDEVMMADPGQTAASDRQSRHGRQAART